MQITSILRRAAQVNPTGIATICKDRQQSWSQMLARVEKLAGALQALGMGPGDRVALLSLNSDRFIEYYFEARQLWGRWLPARFFPFPRSFSFARHNVHAVFIPGIR